MVTHEEDIAAFTNRIIRFRDGSLVSDTPNIPVTKREKEELEEPEGSKSRKSRKSQSIRVGMHYAERKHEYGVTRH